LLHFCDEFGEKLTETRNLAEERVSDARVLVGNCARLSKTFEGRVDVATTSRPVKRWVLAS